MTREECRNEPGIREHFDTTSDIFMIVASNLSNFHHYKNILSDEEFDGKLNSLKELIFDYMAVIGVERENGGIKK